jgi:hypothetical protein
MQSSKLQQTKIAILLCAAAGTHQDGWEACDWVIFGNMLNNDKHLPVILRYISWLNISSCLIGIGRVLLEKKNQSLYVVNPLTPNDL